ncbi:MAG: alpha/beta hydrolase fold domain-containing protein [Lachnospiraceae bacterium]|nr:alpha/beta hydrolase fold domain-containing protein [Ruminococcus sp.]MCM1275750.1 alpha/beta hydrolase fold domain-containing protein [Lachnospiraceae bacterium]
MKYKIDRELKKIARNKAPSNIYLYPIVNIAMKLSVCKSDDKVIVNKYVTPGYKNARLSSLVIEPREHSGILPCIIFYHGGGFLLKASKAHYQIAKWYAEKAKCKVVLTDYRLLPKNKFPVAVEDCYCTYKWVLDNDDMLGINRDKIIVAGDSAGGNLAAAVTLMLWDRNRLSPFGAMLIYPVTDRRMITNSMKMFTDTPIWDAKLTKMFWRAYLGDKEPEQIQYASPIEAKSLEHFPNTYIEVAEFDCLRDEGIAFADRLQSEGVITELYEVKGACHGFETALESSIIAEAMERRIRWIKSLLNKQ